MINRYEELCVDQWYLDDKRTLFPVSRRSEYHKIQVTDRQVHLNSGSMATDVHRVDFSLPSKHFKYLTFATINHNDTI